MSKVVRPIQLFKRLGQIQIIEYAPLAQLVEHLTLNQGVLGSSPRWCTRSNRVRFSYTVFRSIKRFEGYKMAEGIKTIVQNRKARHDYFIEETIEAGIELTGTEVKSLRLGKANLRDSYAAIKDGEVFVHGLHISPYDMGNRFNHDPLRVKKLLLHRHEINRLSGLIQRQGLTLVPLSLYFKRGKVKVELAIAKGKKLYDKREDIAKKDAMREIDRRLKNY